MKEIDKKYIRECFHLAKQSLGRTTPNPLVGSVIVKDGEVISHGFHRKSGEAHAEIDAIQNAKTDLTGATLYCNLEPCCHTGKKTPPCTDAILKTGIKRVVISNLDPNPQVAGRGVEILSAAGIEVINNILREEGALLNEVFFTHIEKKRPFIHLKWAQTLDGKVATLDLDSKWVTNETSRAYAHRERSLYDGILVGSGTVNKDDPKLTVRIPGKPVECRKRIIMGGSEVLNPNSTVFNDEFKNQTIIINDKHSSDLSYIKQITGALNDEIFDLETILSQLYNEGITSIYVEGGMQTISHFINKDIFDRVSVFIAPKLLGPGIGLSSRKVNLMHDAISFKSGVWTQLGDNMLFESKRNVCLQD